MLNRFKRYPKTPLGLGYAVKEETHSPLAAD